MASGIEAGTESFLLSVNWLKKYSAFILFDQFKNNLSEDKLRYKEDHFTASHPGPITNEEDLLEEDPNGNNIYGTGKMKGLESEYIDTYVDQNRSVHTDFICINTELWQFLFERYGGSIVKRYYVRGNSMYTNVDSKLKAISVKILDAQDLISGNTQKGMFKQWWTQIGKNANIKDLKYRMLDTLNCAGYEIEQTDVRLWLF